MKRQVVVSCALLAACGASTPLPRPAAPTGKTVHFKLEITAVDWEVAPGAVYRALTYNRTLPGPVLEMNAGDTANIELTNHDSAPHSLHTHVSHFEVMADGHTQGVVPPGETRSFQWRALYPGTFPYHDHAAPAGEGSGVAAGLIGAVVVHDPAAQRAEHENVVVLADLEPARFVTRPALGHAFLHVINGRAYPSWTPHFAAKVGDRVRWRVVSIGSEFHTFHVHGHRWLSPDGAITDNIVLGPGMSSTLEWVEDAPGEWLYHCHVPDHMAGGMAGLYRVAAAK